MTFASKEGALGNACLAVATQEVFNFSLRPTASSGTSWTRERTSIPSQIQGKITTHNYEECKRGSKDGMTQKVGPKRAPFAVKAEAQGELNCSGIISAFRFEAAPCTTKLPRRPLEFHNLHHRSSTAQNLGDLLFGSSRGSGYKLSHLNAVHPSSARCPCQPLKGIGICVPDQTKGDASDSHPQRLLHLAVTLNSSLSLLDPEMCRITAFWACSGGYTNF